MAICEAGGPAAADLLLGIANPAGRLAETYPLRYQDVISSAHYGRQPEQVPYYESMYAGYRYFDSAGVEVLFPFGHGLSYTTFAYSNMQVTPRKVQSDKEIRVNFRVTNNGPVAGTGIAQVYLSLPGGLGEPPKRLAGWARVSLEPGERRQVVVTLDPHASQRPLSFWDGATGNWQIAPGEYQVIVGASSRDIRLTERFYIEKSDQS